MYWETAHLVAELAQATGHSTRSLTSYLEELRRTEVSQIYRAANQHEVGRIEIRDRFWPYEKQQPASLEDPEQALFVTRVRGLFLEPACVSSAFSAADEKLAADWYRAGVALDQIQRTILLGCARKYVALFNHPGGSPITSLQYFAGLLQEVAGMKLNLNYWRYLAARVRKMESQWRAQANFAPAEPSQQQKRNDVAVSPTFFLTHDDHLPHNTFASVARRCSDRLQLGMSDFLRRNPHAIEFT